MPFDHLVVVMLENHSFDNLLGALPALGRRAADGLTFDRAGRARNSNPGPDGPVRAYPFPSTAQGIHVSQTWNMTHQQINGGRMDLPQVFARPVARPTPYRTPLRGVYLCSASTPPGGGVHGMGGYFAATAALSDLR